MPRVIAGKARRTPLETLKGTETRPSLDRMKEALFSALQNHLQDARFLDLCAGSGQMGIEALSRGAESAVFVEAYPPAMAVVRRNLARTHLEAQAECHTEKIERALARWIREGRVFDLIFWDPPWKDLERLLRSIQSDLPRILHPEGILVIESSEHLLPPDELGALKLERACHYGAAMLSFYQFSQGDEGDGGVQ